MRGLGPGAGRRNAGQAGSVTGHRGGDGTETYSVEGGSQ